MLTKLEVRTEAGSLLVLPLDDVSDGYALTNVEGLDPVKATVVSSSFAAVDGAHFHSARRELRNILITLKLLPDFVASSARSLRTNLYDYFMPKSEVQLRFFDDSDLTVNISGRVETLEAPLWTEEPEANISILCFDPDFVELDSITVEGDTVDDTTEFLITYDGSVETGFEFVLNVDRVLDEFTIYHRPPDNVVRTMDFAASLVADDVVTINTNVGEKAATLLRSSTLSSILYGVSAQSTWFELVKGDNYLRVFAEGAAIPFTIEYTQRHGGL